MTSLNTSLENLKARFPKAFSAVTLALAVGSVAGIAAYEKHAQAADSCCHPGAPCCYPGSPCCAGHKH